MKLNEFKAWLDGYCEALSGRAPNEDEWKRIREVIGSIEPLSPAICNHHTVLTREVPVWPQTTPMIQPHPAPWNPLPQVWCQSTGSTNGHANHSMPVITGGIANGIN